MVKRILKKRGLVNLFNKIDIHRIMITIPTQILAAGEGAERVAFKTTTLVGQKGFVENTCLVIVITFFLVQKSI